MPKYCLDCAKNDKTPAITYVVYDRKKEWVNGVLDRKFLHYRCPRCCAKFASVEDFRWLDYYNPLVCTSSCNS